MINLFFIKDFQEKANKLYQVNETMLMIKNIIKIFLLNELLEKYCKLQFKK